MAEDHKKLSIDEKSAFIVYTAEVNWKDEELMVTFHGVFTLREEAEKRSLLLAKDNIETEIEEVCFDIPLPTTCSIREKWSCEIINGDFENFRIRRKKELFIDDKTIECELDVKDINHIKIYTFNGNQDLFNLIDEAQTHVQDFRRGQTQND
jgi:hypothetical protein